jgi:hypothetical protein
VVIQAVAHAAGVPLVVAKTRPFANIPDTVTAL